MKMFVLLFALVSVDALAQARNYVNAAGTVVTREAEYSVVINSASAALTVGQAVCLDLTADDGVSVDYCTANGMPLGLITDTSCAVGARCKLIKRGYFASASFGSGLGNAVAGSAGFASTDGTIYGDTTDENKHPVGAFLDSASATAAVEFFVHP